MGCRKLAYYENESPLKVVYSAFRNEEKVVQGFLTPDPLERKFPMWSPYIFAANSPIRFNDENGLAPGDPQRSLSAKEIGTFLGQGNNIGKVLLLNSLSKESQKTTIVLTGADILKAAQTNKSLAFLKDQASSLNNIESVTLSKGIATINLKEGVDQVSLNLPKGALKLSQGATIDATGLSVKEKTLTDYQGNPTVQDVSGNLEISGVKASFLGIKATPESVSFKSGVVTNTPDNGKAFDTFDTSADIDIKESYLPNQKDKFVGYQNLPEKKK